eukprot:1168035-Amphidinium_carterae.2
MTNLIQKLPSKALRKAHEITCCGDGRGAVLVGVAVEDLGIHLACSIAVYFFNLECTLFHGTCGREAPLSMNGRGGVTRTTLHRDVGTG